MPAKKLIGFTIVTLAALALLVGLGVWQLQRLEWKRSLIAEIETRTKAPPSSLAEALALKDDDPSYLRVHVAGRFQNDKEKHLYAIADGAPGWHLLTPLVTEDGAIVLVDRGFVPDAMKEQATRPQSLVEGETSVTGLVRLPESKGTFTPNTDLDRNRWYFRDLDGMARSMFGDRPQNLAPFFLEAEASGPPGSWPRGGQTRLDLPNNHLQYALTWFLLAFCLLVIYAVFVRQALRAPKP